MKMKIRSFAVSVLAVCWFGVLGSGAAASTPPTLFILDASGSMWGRVGSVEKIVVAKGTLIDLIQSLDSEDEVGLLAYGHRRKGDCDDIELLAPVASRQQDSLVRRVQALNPKGKTPIVRSLRSAAELPQLADGELVVVLLSDGRETCDEEPCELVAQLWARGLRLHLFVIGFAVSEAEAEELRCLAKAGGGAYFAAADADGLRWALVEVEREISADKGKEAGRLVVTASGNDLYRVYAQDAEDPLASARTNEVVELDPGIYRVRLGATSQWVVVRAGEETTLGAGSVVVRGLGKGLYELFDLGGETKYDFTRTNRAMDVLSGSYVVRLEGTQREVLVKAGETTVVEAANLVVEGDSGDLYAVYDPTGQTKYQFTRVGKPLELLPGFYSVKVGDRWIHDVELSPGQQLRIQE